MTERICQFAIKRFRTSPPRISIKISSDVHNLRHELKLHYRYGKRNLPKQYQCRRGPSSRHSCASPQQHSSLLKASDSLHMSYSTTTIAPNIATKRITTIESIKVLAKNPITTNDKYLSGLFTQRSSGKGSDGITNLVPLKDSEAVQYNRRQFLISDLKGLIEEGSSFELSRPSRENGTCEDFWNGVR